MQVLCCFHSHFIRGNSCSRAKRFLSKIILHSCTIRRGPVCFYFMKTSHTLTNRRQRLISCRQYILLRAQSRLGRFSLGASRKNIFECFIDPPGHVFAGLQDFRLLLRCEALGDMLPGAFIQALPAKCLCSLCQQRGLVRQL